MSLCNKLTSVPWRPVSEVTTNPTLSGRHKFRCCVESLNWDWQWGEICPVAAEGPESITSSPTLLLATESFFWENAKWVNQVLLVLVCIVLHGIQDGHQDSQPPSMLLSFPQVLARVDFLFSAAAFFNLFLNHHVHPLTCFSFPLIYPVVKVNFKHRMS